MTEESSIFFVYVTSSGVENAFNISTALDVTKHQLLFHRRVLHSQLFQIRIVLGFIIVEFFQGWTEHIL